MKKRVISALLTLVLLSSMLLTSCGGLLAPIDGGVVEQESENPDLGTGIVETDQKRVIYDAYVAKLAAKGEKPLSYDAWLASIKGDSGMTPYIGENGNWFIGDSDTGVSAKGDTPNIEVGKDGHWWIDGKNTGVKADGGDTIKSVAVNSEGKLVITMESGKKHTVDLSVGEDSCAHRYGASVLYSSYDVHCDERMYYSVCSECKEIKWTEGDQGHEPLSAWKRSSTGHWHACQNCNDTVDFASHTFDDFNRCTVCGYIYNQYVPGGNVEVGLDTYTDLGGYTYKAYVRSSESGNGGFLCEDFWVEAAGTDPVTYAVYQRNADIENAYNCKIRQVGSRQHSMYDEMKSFYLNGETYELGIIEAMNAAACSTSCLLQDIYSLDSIRLENTTYDQNSVDQFTMGGCLYYLSGDMNISTMDSAAVTIFNPELHEDYDFETIIGDGAAAYNDPYKMVEDGDWTLENMLKMANVVNRDTDHTGGVLDATTGDYVGYFQYSASAQYYWFGCGARLSQLTDMSEGGYPEIAFDSDKAEETFTLLYNSLNTAVENTSMPIGGSGTRKDNYATGYTLFTDILLWDVRKHYYPAEYDYCILPIPKAGSTQERYYDIVYYPYQTVHLWTVPSMCANKDYASFLFNVIAVYSARVDNTMDAYYTKTLELSVAQDAEARSTLKIVRDNLTYDMCLLYDWGDFLSGTLLGIHSATSNGYADATTQDDIDLAVEEMERTLQGFREPQLPEEEE
ncbi:MAG: hypothetical protein E7643_00275 [Ruminococcaceae bacterium]|nr:hypothetical protein [Oscillospiraceae bacterium]